jgi:predicted glutamine amidotransferase
MCIAILKPAGVVLPEKRIFETSESNNSHGAGYAIFNPKKKELIIKKPFFTFNNFYDSLLSEENLYESVLMAHFRIATSGLKDENNTHPHYIRLKNGEVAFAHNGVVSGVGNKDKSDTVFLADFIRGRNFEDYQKFLELVAINSQSKFVFIGEMFRNGFKIMNESLGAYDDGVWYSNKSYQKEKTYSYGNWKQYYNDEYWERLYQTKYPTREAEAKTEEKAEEKIEEKIEEPKKQLSLITSCIKKEPTEKSSVIDNSVSNLNTNTVKKTIAENLEKLSEDYYFLSGIFENGSELLYNTTINTLMNDLLYTKLDEFDIFAEKIIFGLIYLSRSCNKLRYLNDECFECSNKKLSLFDFNCVICENNVLLYSEAYKIALEKQ